MKDNHTKQSPVLTLTSLGGGSHSSYVYKAGDSGGGGGGGQGGGGGGGGGGTPAGEYDPDGTAIYVMSSDNIVRRHNMSTAFDITTMSYNSASSALETTTAGNCRGIYFNGDGTKLYYIFYENTSPYASFVKTKSLSTAWDITNMSDASESINFTSNLNNIGKAKNLTFKHDGTKMYIVDGTSDGQNYILEFDLSTAWDVSTASYSQQSSTNKFQGFSFGYLRGAAFNDDGTRLFTLNAGNTNGIRWPLTTAWDVSTIGSGSSSAFYQGIKSFDYEGCSILWKRDGTKYYLLGKDDELITQFEPAAAYTGAFQWGALKDNPGNDAQYTDYSCPADKASNFQSIYACTFGDNGNYIYTSNGYSVQRFALGTAYDLKTMTQSGYTNFSTNYGYAPKDIKFNSTGTKFLLGPEQQNKGVKQWNLSTAWDLSTASDSGNELDLTADSTGITNPAGGCISDDGKHIYAVQFGQSKVWHWSLTTAFDISTASFSEVGTNFTQPWTSVRISPDGTQLITWYATSHEETFRSYTLSTAYDVSTATADKSFNVPDDVQGVPSPIFATAWIIHNGGWIMLPYYGFAQYTLRFGSGAGSDWPFNLDNAEFSGSSPHYSYHTNVNAATRGAFLK